MSTPSLDELVAAALTLWARGFNTAEIAQRLKIGEPIVQRWIWSLREASRS